MFILVHSLTRVPGIWEERRKTLVGCTFMEAVQSSSLPPNPTS